MSGTIPIRRILLIRPSALGDVCRSVPVLASLRATWPQAKIHWLVQDSFREAVEFHPSLDGVVPFQRSLFRGGRLSPSRWRLWARWMLNIGRGDWDLVVDCQGLARTGLMTWASRAPIRVGDHGAREGAWLAYNRTASPGAELHEVDRMLAVVAAAGATITHDPTLYPGTLAQQWWEAHPSALSATRYAVLSTTSRWQSKAWPRAHWVALATSLRDLGLDAVVLSGSASEQSDVAQTADAMRSTGIKVQDVSGQTGIAQLMAVIEGAAITVANDSAALHMAVGLGGRCLGLFGPTNPAIVGPWQRDSQALRAPLIEGEPQHYRDGRIGDSIMSRLSVEQVADRAASLIAEWGV